MAENEPKKVPAGPPPRKPYGPGVLMIFGLALLAIAAWCAKDSFWPPESWIKEQRTGTIWFNKIALIPSLLGAIYAFVLAAIRSRKGAGGAGEASGADEAGETPGAAEPPRDPAQPPQGANPPRGI